MFDNRISKTLSQTLGMRDCDVRNEINEPTVAVLSDAAAAATAAAVVNEVSPSSSEDNTISDSSSTVSEDTTDYSLEFRNTALQSSLGIGTKQRSSPNRVWDISKMKSSPNRRSNYQKITDDNEQQSSKAVKKVNSSNSKIQSMKSMKFSRFSPSFRDGDSQQYITVNDEEEVVCNKLLSCSGDSDNEVYEKEGVVTITANKPESHSKVGLIFTRSKKSSSSSSTLSNDNNKKEAIISGVTDDSIFKVYKSDLVNSPVLAVNDIQVTSAKHAANLVANAINEVRLVIVQHHNKQQVEDTNEMVDINNSLELELQNHEKRMIQAKIDRAKRSSASNKVSLNAVLDVVNENDEECMSIDPDISVYDSVDSDDEDMKVEGHTQEEKEQFLLDIQKKKQEKTLKQQKKNVVVEASDDVSTADWSHADVIQSAFGKKNDIMKSSTTKIRPASVTPDQAVLDKSVNYSSPVLGEDASILPEQSEEKQVDTNVKPQETVVSPDSTPTTTEKKKIKKKRMSVKRALGLIVKEVTEQTTETLPPVVDKSDDVQLTPDTLVDGAVVEPNAAAASAEDIMNDLNINDSKEDTKESSETTEGKTHYITVDEDNLSEQQPHHPLARVLSNTTNPDAVEVKKSPSMVEGFVAATERASSYINQSIMTSLSYGEESVVNAKDEVIESLVDDDDEDNVEEGVDEEPDTKELPIDDDEPPVKKDQVEEQSELIVTAESPVKKKKSFFTKRSQKNSVANNEKAQEPTTANAQPVSTVQTPVKKKKSFLKRFKKSSKPVQEVDEVSDKDATEDKDAESVKEHDISLDVTASGDIEIQTPSSRGPFDCTLSPISVKTPSDKLDCDVNVTRTSSVPASVATASFSLSSNEEHATPPTNKSIPQTPQAPIKISQGWNVASFLFGSPQEGFPSPCASILGSTPAECCSCDSPASSSGSKDFADIDEPLTVECRLNSIGNDSIKISMERNDEIKKTSTESISLSELGPPQVNRKLDFDGLCQETFQSRAVDVATVYRDDNSFSGMPDPATPRRHNTWEDIKEFALAKKTAFEIIKRKSPRNGGKYTKNDITMETLNVTETSML